MPEEHKKYELIINGRPRQWDKESINYTEVVDLAFPPPHKPTEIITVQYSHGPDVNPKGTLAEGQTVIVKGGMIFDVVRTDKS